MWLIARRSFAEGWMRLAATMLAALFSIGLISGSLQFGLRAQEAVSGSDASEYSRADVLVQGGQADPDDPYATPDGRVALGEVAGRPGVAAAAGDAMVPATAYGSDRTPIVPPAGAGTTLRPWTSDGRLNPYRLESGRAPAADGEVAVTRHVARAGGLDVGDPVKVMLPKRTRDMRVVGIVTVQGRSAVASGDLLLAPPATVQRAAGLPADTWQAVWVKAAAACLRDAARCPGPRPRRGRHRPDGGERPRRPVGGLRDSGASIGGAIGMLSSVAVFVGLFVVANTFGTLVRQRTRRLALLSAIGATPRQIRRLIRLEALALGAVASAGGVLAATRCRPCSPACSPRTASTSPPPTRSTAGSRSPSPPRRESSSPSSPCGGRPPRRPDLPMQALRAASADSAAAAGPASSARSRCSRSPGCSSARCSRSAPRSRRAPTAPSGRAC